MRIIEVNPEDVDHTEAKIQVNFSEVKICMVEVNAIKIHTKTNIKTIAIKVIEVYIITQRNFQQDNNYGQFRGRSSGRGRANYHRCSHGRSNYQGNTNYQYHHYYGHDAEYQTDQYGPPFSLCGGYNLNIVLRENTISMILWKR